ncbi:hypothetical protein PHET_10015 [Paragonimus heterotremus]|uniref:Uncharacterized protein n=1 Tax=Paragonimus heterotremus TaxID=100268 RepID=A0A8J4T3R6_9TREM|nr:hypothetical protein PHET_10015 [Paragonimus heterotremus]
MSFICFKFYPVHLDLEMQILPSRDLQIRGLRRFMPVIIKFLYGIPVIGWILWLPGVNKIVTMLGGQSNSMV